MQLTEQLKELIEQTRTKNKHLLIIDGLDDVLTNRSVQYQSIAALIFETDRLNMQFLRSGSPCKIIVLCRTDLFEKLPGPNKNKLRQDSAFELDWYHDSREPRKSDLIALAKLRSSLTFEDISLFQDYFLPEVNGKSIEHFLLDHTRHTPRDFIQLLNHLKPYSQKTPMNKAQVFSGIANYSKNYFLPEIKDEMVGYTDGDTFDEFLKIIGSFRDREISYPKLMVKCFNEINMDEAILRKILADLFNCSAIGNKYQTKNNSVRYYFKYRNKNDSINFGESIVIHMGLWKALNLV